MTHIREQVRKAAVTAFSGLTLDGKAVQVFTGRIAPIGKTDMPCINLLLLDETAQWDSMPTMARTGRLIAECRAMGKLDGLLDRLDDFAALVEARAYAPATSFDDLLTNIDVPTTQIDLPEPEQGNAQGVGIVRLLFPVIYRTVYTDPETKA